VCGAKKAHEDRLKPCPYQKAHEDRLKPCPYKEKINEYNEEYYLRKKSRKSKIIY
jgi:hypothetical protein